MLRPSYSDLLLELNKNETEEDSINSRYTIVIAAAKRARELVLEQEPLTMNYKTNKPVTVAVQELYENKIKIIQNFDNPNIVKPSVNLVEMIDVGTFANAEIAEEYIEEEE